MSNILTELLPRKVRLWLYVIVFFALLVLAAWQAAEGEWLVFVATLLSSLAPLLAASNVNPETPPAIEPKPLPTDPSFF